MAAEEEKLKNWVERATTLGASAAAVIPARSLVVEDRFAEMCATPQRCPSYRLAPGCPPHAMQPPVFRKLVASYHQILVFKMDAPVTALMGQARLPIARKIHFLAATLEQEAIAAGMLHARGLAAGSCKELFCAQHEVCVVLEHQQPCPHAHQARPSISALGVNFSALAQSVGWPFGPLDPKTAATGEPAMGLMAGLVLLR